MVSCVKPCNHEQKKCSSTIHDLSPYLPRILLTVSCFPSISLEAALHLKPASSFRQSSACSQAIDWCHVNVSAGFSVSGAAGFMWSHCAVVCLNKLCMYHENYHVFVEASWDCLGLEAMIALQFHFCIQRERDLICELFQILTLERWEFQFQKCCSHLKLCVTWLTET